jgi:hypothetical protein
MPDNSVRAPKGSWYAIFTGVASWNLTQSDQSLPCLLQEALYCPCRGVSISKPILRQKPPVSGAPGAGRSCLRDIAQPTPACVFQRKINRASAGRGSGTQCTTTEAQVYRRSRPQGALSRIFRACSSLARSKSTMMVPFTSNVGVVSWPLAHPRTRPAASRSREISTSTKEIPRSFR